ncbi:MAG: hypothetical protein GEU78_17465 [Actinobacteria bacterium]|nr:hypothetical protein [Actinomycetota bacterium]
MAYLLVFLVAIRDLTIAPGRDMLRFVDIPSVEVVPSWPSRMFERLALFQFKPIAAVYPVNHVEILVSPLNIVTGLVLGLLIGLNIAVAWHIVATVRACGTRAFGGLLGALPRFLTGFACCVPTLAVVVGAQFSVFLTAVRSWFVPVAVLTGRSCGTCTELNTPSKRRLGWDRRSELNGQSRTHISSLFRGSDPTWIG